MNERQKDLVQKFAALGGLFVLVTVFSLASPAFFGVGNGMTVALQVTSIAYLGIGATCVIITGGIGTVSGTLIGAFVIGILRNGLNMTGVSAFVQQIIIGLVILVTVWIDQLRNRR
jgi:ribose/xylose/arabinose/galactoside ABC-type transport system permease subunit